MQQFRPFLPFQQADEADIIEETPVVPLSVACGARFNPLVGNSFIVGVVADGISAATAPSAIQTDQHPVVTTEPLPAFAPIVVLPTMQDSTGTTEPLKLLSGPLPTVTVTPSLTAALQTTPSATSMERIIVIPGSGKRAASKTAAPHLPMRMSPHLRLGIVLTTLLFVVVVSLLSLSPSATGQYGFPIFRNINNWFQVQQLIWQLQVQNQQRTLPAPPSVNLPSSPYVAVAEQDAINAGISPDYFVRQINQESRFNPNAVSPAGAIGIAQFMPGTAASHGINPWDPTQALQGGAHLMANYVNQYGGNYAMALAAYNAGPGAVQYALNVCGANWMNCLPAETRNYIYVIMGI